MIALGLSNGPTNADSLIRFGADEVVQFDYPKVGGWPLLISNFINSESGLRMVIFPSDIMTNALMGMILASIPEKISSYLEDADSLNSDESAKRLDGFLLIQKGTPEGKTRLASLKLSSVPEPFEDSSRSGKVRAVAADGEKGVPPPPPIMHSWSTVPVILVGQGVTEETTKLASQLAQKYSGVLRFLSGKMEVVYGPCIAIEVSAKLRDLPEFKADLISISSKKLPINSIAEISAVTPELDKLLKILVRS